MLEPLGFRPTELQRFEPTGAHQPSSTSLMVTFFSQHNVCYYEAKRGGQRTAWCGMSEVL